jgi:cytochrome c-type biogenesis protein CcmH/NrfG
MKVRGSSLVALAMLLSACTSLPMQPGAPPSEPAPPAEASRTETVAIASLMESAQADTQAGRLANAAASLERALRIEPRNPRVWHELARVRLAQGDYMQVEGLAARSNTWARDNPALRAENWRLIAKAREARGDAQGAQTALDAAARQR